MPILTGSVGKGGNNQIHDVAVVQGALATVIGANRRPIWQGAVDGRKGKPVEDAIAAFQAANRMPPTGRLNQSGAEINRLEQALPPGHKAIMDDVVGLGSVVRLEDLRDSNTTARCPIVARILGRSTPVADVMNGSCRLARRAGTSWE